MTDRQNRLQGLLTTYLAGAVVLALALAVSGYEIYLRRQARPAPAESGPARAAATVAAVKETGWKLALDALPFNQKVEARLVFDDLVARSGRLTGQDLQDLEAARTALAGSPEGPQRSAAAQAYLAECRRILDRH